jgi:branched-chain amino acid transport system ATP-binding protein
MQINNTQSLQNVKNRPVILTGEKLTKFFGGLAAVNDVYFQVHEKEILGLIGPNGAGKTTLFNMIAGVLKPDRGTILYRDKTINSLRPSQICKMGIARTFQIPLPFLNMRVLENVMVGSYFGSHEKRNLKKCKNQAEKILSFVGLLEKSYDLASQLTLAERKSLELARSLSTEPSIILLDEVVGGLNPKETLEMMELIKQIRRDGMAILMIEHVMKAVMGVSDRVIVLQQGRKIAEGAPSEVRSNRNVIEAYLGKGGI